MTEIDNQSFSWIKQKGDSQGRNLCICRNNTGFWIFRHFTVCNVILKELFGKAKGENHAVIAADAKRDFSAT